MNTTNSSTEVHLSVADNDSKRLAIIYGTLGTLIALAGLVFAALTWARSRPPQSEPNVKTDRTLVNNELEPEVHGAYELQESAVADAPVAVARSVISKSIDVDSCLLFKVLNKKGYPDMTSPKPSRTTVRALLSSRGFSLPFRDG